ncbi:peptidyl-prolyl cis-trans isomerase [Tetranychus urticae]|uniref:Peptidyl-prolyl cis-trans isomerase n=1 Tax=Tetranychus urticae TaxID=32264 RepID=T1JUN5_TETUR|nr:peptidyl-prolyl cis-trans isomerase [Tetranychus urticae]
MSTLPKCFLDVSAGGKPLGRIVVELRSDVVPKTVDNFIGLCTHRPGYGYKKTRFNRVIPGFMIQGGKISEDESKQSIYGGRFEDENFELNHVEPGILSMANRGPNTNGSSFFITTSVTDWLDGKHVVFGKVIEGMKIVKAIEALGTESGSTEVDIVIEDCGQLK